MNLLLTGSTGFLGTALAKRLGEDNCYQVTVAVREQGNITPGFRSVLVGDLDAKTDWKLALLGAEVVVHASALVNRVKGSDQVQLAEFRRVNVDGTLNFARQAVRASVKRFIFVSSIKVNGEGTPLNQPYTLEDIPAPVDPYGISKREIEDGLRELAEKTDMEVVIIRPPLVYGPRVKANFLSMMRWLYRGVPLPLGSIHNKRSMIALDNLVDFIVTCMDHPAASNQVFLVSDNNDLSTTELLQRMARALGKSSRLFPAPVWLLQSAAVFAGKHSVSQRLLGSLQVDTTITKEILGWVPPMSVDDALRKTAEDFLVRQKF